MKQTPLETTSNKPPDRRRKLRWCVDYPSTFEYQGQACEGEVIDLSLAGVFVKSEIKPGVGQVLEMTIGLPKSAPICFSGTVMHVGRFLCGYANFRGFGLKFDRIKHPDLTKLFERLEVGSGPAEPKYVLEIEDQDSVFR